MPGPVARFVGEREFQSFAYGAARCDELAVVGRRQADQSPVIGCVEAWLHRGADIRREFCTPWIGRSLASAGVQAVPHTRGTFADVAVLSGGRCDSPTLAATVAPMEYTLQRCFFRAVECTDGAGRRHEIAFNITEGVLGAAKRYLPQPAGTVDGEVFFRGLWARQPRQRREREEGIREALGEVERSIARLASDDPRFPDECRDFWAHSEARLKDAQALLLSEQMAERARIRAFQRRAEAAARRCVRETLASWVADDAALPPRRITRASEVESCTHSSLRNRGHEGSGRLSGQYRERAVVSCPTCDGTIEQVAGVLARCLENAAVARLEWVESRQVLDLPYLRDEFGAAARFLPRALAGSPAASAPVPPAEVPPLAPGPLGVKRRRFVGRH